MDPKSALGGPKPISRTELGRILLWGTWPDQGLQAKVTRKRYALIFPTSTSDSSLKSPKTAMRKVMIMVDGTASVKTSFSITFLSKCVFALLAFANDKVKCCSKFESVQFDLPATYPDGRGHLTLDQATAAWSTTRTNKFSQFSCKCIWIWISFWRRL